jgi:histidine kinase
LIGKSFFDLGADDFQDGVLATSELLTSTLCSAYPKIRHQRKDGSHFYVDVYACRTKYSRKYGIIATTVDVTESLVKETQLIQASKMATLGEMATGVAHELNQPLSVIKTASTFLKKKVDAKEGIQEEILKTMADEIDGHVDRASRIIKHMREFGRKSDVTREKVQVNEPLSKALEIFSQQLTLRDITVTKELDEDLPHISADANRLEQVFINLLTNARDAIEDRWQGCAPGQAEKRITLKTQLEGDQIRVEVADTGTGIPEAIQNKIFEPFFTTKKVGKGTGLGLSISYGIIQEYDGEIRVVSKASGGTTFVLKFPVAGEK